MLAPLLPSQYWPHSPPPRPTLWPQTCISGWASQLNLAVCTSVRPPSWGLVTTPGLPLPLSSGPSNARYQLLGPSSTLFFLLFPTRSSTLYCVWSNTAHPTLYHDHFYMNHQVFSPGLLKWPLTVSVLLTYPLCILFTQQLVVIFGNLSLVILLCSKPSKASLLTQLNAKILTLILQALYELTLGLSLFTHLALNTWTISLDLESHTLLHLLIFAQDISAACFLGPLLRAIPGGPLWQP